MVTKYTIPGAELPILESTNSVLVLGSSGGVIMIASLFTILACSANGVVGGSTADKTESKFVQISTNSKLLDMGKCQVSKFDMPTEPC